MNRAQQHRDYSVEWGTPPDLFARLHREFRFTLDVAARPWNAKTKRFFTPEQDGLLQTWAPERVWLNPPYGREIDRWVLKAALEAQQGALVVALLPGNLDAGWFHNFVVLRASEIRLLRGRVYFVREDGQAARRPVGSNVVAIYEPGGRKTKAPKLGWMYAREPSSTPVASSTAASSGLQLVRP